MLPKPKKAGVVSPNHLNVLAKTMGVENQDQEKPKVSTPPMTPTKVGGRSVLDELQYGPGNRSCWELKKGTDRVPVS